jgi:aminoglycoside phosphotransferase family enzyme/predicted kinase
VEFIQTHISSIFLTGDVAYKLKKPVDFGFLDFSTVELRERYCRAEVELNRRLAPAVYRGVRPITLDNGQPTLDGSGEVVDWLVEMTQLDQELLGVTLLEQGRLTAEHIDQLVDCLAPFYKNARTGAGIDRYGTLEAAKFNTDENFTQTESYVGKLLTRERFDQIRNFTNGFYEANVDLFARRVADGRIRESHGDLHLNNIFFSDPPIIFDCIEFSDRLRCGDVAVDLAFLAMDLDFRGRPDFSQQLIEGYVAASGDSELPRLLDLYCCYRAYVRGKICAFTAVDPAVGDVERRQHRNLARHYFGLAYRYAGGEENPPLIVLFGLMGTGKTSVARFLRESFGWHLISTDAVRKQIAGVGEATRVYVPYNEGLYSPDMNRRTYEEVARRAENLLQAGLPVVVDGAYKKASERRTLLDLAERTGARLRLMRTVCDEETQRRRLASRQLHDTRSDGRVELMERQRSEFEGPDARETPLVEVVSTDGPKEDTRRNVIEHLRSLGIFQLHEHAELI